MARLNTHLTRSVAVSVGALVAATLPIVAGEAADSPVVEGPAVVFYTPGAGDTVRVGSSTSAHILLGADAEVTRIRLQITPSNGSPWETNLTRASTGSVFEATWTTTGLGNGSAELKATAYTAGPTPPTAVAQEPVTQTVTLSTTAGTSYTEPSTVDAATRETLCGPFIRPRRKVVKGSSACAAVPLGVFTSKLDGHTYARVTGKTSGTVAPEASAPTLPAVAPPARTAQSPAGTFDAARKIFRVPVDLTGNPGLAARRAVIRVGDGISSEAVETPLYAQIVTHVRSTATRVAAGYAIRSTLADQYGQPVVGAPARLTGYVNGSRTPVNQLVATDINGVATFPSAVPANGFYIAIADLDLNGKKAAAEPSFETVLGHVTYAAPGRALYHNNSRLKGSSGTLGDTLRGTKAAAARRYRWIDQDGHLAFTRHADKARGAGRVTQAGQVTWVNAHGAPFSPKWLKKGRFETRAWAALKKRKGLRNADMTFKQNAAHGLSVEWEVKDIKPFTTPAALDAAFASLAASARRHYGAGWRSRVEIKVLSNLSGGQAFALKVLKAAHAHGFTTMYLARGKATTTQIPSSAHAYVDHVRGARNLLYAYAPPAWQRDLPVPVDPPLRAR